ncbi:MAG: YdeI/OmpD-associated family protein [Candidatus Eremiobacterota bacterium]
MDIGKTLYVTNRKDWRLWLEKNYETEKDIWLIYYKKQSSRPRIPYDDAVEEALCFGWIDSIMKKIDEEKFAQKFTPGRNNKKWSELNIKRVRKMIEEGKMTEAGLKKIDKALLNEDPKKKDSPSEAVSYLEEALKDSVKALDFFTSLAPSYKKHYIKWTESAKREETRMKRIKEAIELLENHQKLGLK